MWRWFSINIDEDLHFGGIRLGTGQGDLHRGWVFDRGRATSVAEWRVRTEVADDGLTQKVVHLDRPRQEGPELRPRRRGPESGRHRRPAGTLINEGLTRWTYRDEDGATRTGYGICRVPAPDRRRRPACRPRRLGGAPRPTTRWPTDSAGPGRGRRAPRPLSGGASRVTSSFDLVALGRHPATAVLQQERGAEHLTAAHA